MTPAEKAALLECLEHLSNCADKAQSFFREIAPGYGVVADLADELRQTDNAIDRLRAMFMPANEKTDLKVCVNRNNGLFSIRREDRDAPRYWTGPASNSFEKESQHSVWETADKEEAQRNLRTLFQ